MGASENPFTPINEPNFMKTMDPYLKSLKTYCLSLSRSKWDGEDLFQETLIKVLKKWQQQRIPVSKAYLFRVASNTWIDQHRKKKPDIDDSAELTGIPSNESGFSAEMEEAMQMLLKTLTPKQRAVLLLTEGFNYSQREVSEMLNCKEGSVRTALHRAKKRLEKASESIKSEEFYRNDTENYLHVFYSDTPYRFAELYKQETGQMNALQQADVSSSAIGSSYCIVSITLRNGATWHIPFYKKEWQLLTSLLETLEMLTSQMYLCA